MYKTVSLHEFASYVADNITTAVSYDFYDRWDTEKNPDGPLGLDAYNCKAELVNGVVHIVANAYGGGAPFCYCANRAFWGPARNEFVQCFVEYLKAATNSETVVMCTRGLPVSCEGEGDGDVYMSPIDFARLVWDCIEKKRSYAFAKAPNTNNLFRIKLINVAESQMMICNDNHGCCLWWCEITDETLDGKIREFAAFLKSAGFHSVYLRK